MQYGPGGSAFGATDDLATGAKNEASSVCSLPPPDLASKGEELEILLKRQITDSLKSATGLGQSNTEKVAQGAKDEAGSVSLRSHPDEIAIAEGDQIADSFKSTTGIGQSNTHHQRRRRTLSSDPRRALVRWLA